jgi:integrase
MRGSLRRRGSSWTIVLDLGYETDPATGKVRRKQKRVAARGTKKEAEDRLTELLGQLRGGTFVEPAKVTVGEWLSHWIETLSHSPDIRPATLARYRSVAATVKAATLAAVRLQAVRPSQIETHYNDLRKTLSAGTVRLHHFVLHRAFRAAVKDKIIAVNVCGEVDNRPKRPKDIGERARLDCWTVEEARRFLAAADAAGPQQSAFYTLALDTGARLRELAGLTWHGREPRDWRPDDRAATQARRRGHAAVGTDEDWQGPRAGPDT